MKQAKHPQRPKNQRPPSAGVCLCVCVCVCDCTFDRGSLISTERHTPSSERHRHMQRETSADTDTDAGKHVYAHVLCLNSSLLSTLTCSQPALEMCKKGWRKEDGRVGGAAQAVRATLESSLVSDFWAWLLLSLQVRSIMVFMLERIQGKAKKGRLSQER